MNKFSLRLFGSLTRTTHFRFSADKEEKSSHIFISTDQISDRAQQLSQIPLRDDIPLFTSEYFKEKGDHMKFRNVALEPKMSASMITGLGDRCIEINGVSYNMPIIVTNNMVFVWELDSIENISPEHFVVLEHLLPDFEYAVLGLGDSKVELKDSVTKFLSKFNKKIDNVDWFLASSAFNNCMENDIEAVGFFYV